MKSSSHCLAVEIIEERNTEGARWETLEMFLIRGDLSECPGSVLHGSESLFVEFELAIHIGHSHFSGLEEFVFLIVFSSI